MSQSALKAGELVRNFLRDELGVDGVVPLHEPLFGDEELALVQDCVRSGWVSSAGAFVDAFEQEVRRFVGVKHAVAVVNGTAALQLALHLVGVRPGDLVVCPALTFVATANAIAHCGATPLLVDSDEQTLGMSVEELRDFLENRCRRGERGVEHEGRRVAACVPVHVFGHACRIEEIVRLCREHGLPVVEDATEALGTRHHGTMPGAFGDLGVFSFNGNKIITTGGGGMIVTDDAELAARARHLSTTAKVAHPWKFLHDEVAWNFRLPNINAALGCAQMKRLDDFIRWKRLLAAQYRELLADVEGVEFIDEPQGCTSNFWLNGLLFRTAEERDAFLAFTHEHDIMTRACWEPMHLLPHHARAPRAGSLRVAERLAARIANIPSSPGLKMSVRQGDAT